MDQIKLRFSKTVQSLQGLAGNDEKRMYRHTNPIIQAQGSGLELQSERREINISYNIACGSISPLQGY